MVQPAHLGVVVIGRNEGERLRRCLESFADAQLPTVYVDSGSTDGSVEWARSTGKPVVMLDMSRPFTAARARNAGFEQLLARNSALEFVQFMDGDCEVIPGWLEFAARELDGRSDAAAVFGRVRERHAERSIYNRLCDMEWDGPAGVASACGGIAMFRVAALQAAGGFRPDLIAGEEPELCLRLRQRGWRIYRLEHEMVLHDAAMTHFGQWWRRAVRGGHAYAEGAWLHGRSPERYRVRQVVSIVFWTAALPLGAAIAALLTNGWALLILTVYPLLAAKIARGFWKRRRTSHDAILYASFTVLAKFAQLQGVARFLIGRLTGRRSPLIEYRQPARPLPAAAEPGRST